MTPRYCVRVFAVAGVPVYVHGSVLLLGLLVGGMTFAPGAWLGAFLVVVVHEIGHLVLMRHYGLHVVEIMVHGFGGYCKSEGWIDPLQQAVIAWGGVLAQAVLFVLFLVPARLSLLPDFPHSERFYETVILANLVIAVCNLLPVAPLDGAEAWKVVPLWFSGWRTARQRRALAESSRLSNDRRTDRARKLGIHIRRHDD